LRIALKSFIFASGKSQRQIAVESHITENRLSEFVRGWTDPNQDERLALMRVLGCPPAVFDKDTTIEARSVRR
jgi:transcriptional regulator with XRE-family HTH domain